MAKLEDVIAFARELNVSDEELIKSAGRYRFDIEGLEQFDESLCDCLMCALKCFVYYKADNPDAVLDDTFEDDEEEEEEDEEPYVSPEDYAWGERYRDYCERKYGWDCS